MLYGTETFSSGGTALTIDISDASGTAIGGVGQLDFSLASGLAFDVNTEVLYGVDHSGGENIFSINTTTGIGTRIGVFNQLVLDGFTQISALAFDPNTGTLYGVDSVIAHS